MTNQTKTPGAKVLVPSELPDRVAHPNKSFAEHRLTQQDLVKYFSVPAEQPPAVGGEPEIQRYSESCGEGGGVYPDRDGELCDYKHVAPLLAEIERLKADIDGYESGEHAAQVADELGYQLLRAKARIAELEAGQGEAVAWYYRGTDVGNVVSLSRIDDYYKVKGEPLYRQAQPAKAKVVLPDRCDDGGTGGADYYIAVGWNACLDTTAKLNGGAE